MKYRIQHLSGIALAVATSLAVAGEVTIPNTFTAGTPAVASEVNANFAAVKAAVDDNNARIVSLGTSKQNRIVGTCAIGMYAAQVNPDGSLVCRQDSAISSVGPGLQLNGSQIRLASGTISVSPATFTSAYEGACFLSKGSANAYWVSTTTLTYCSAYSPVQLPQGATLTGLHCRGYDNSPGGTGSFALLRTGVTSGGTEFLLGTAGTVDSSDIQLLSDTTVTGSAIVDNNNFTYVLQWYWSGNANTVSTAGQARSCQVTYTY